MCLTHSEAKQYEKVGLGAEKADRNSQGDSGLYPKGPGTP